MSSFRTSRFRLDSRSGGTVTQETTAKGGGKTVDLRASTPLSPSDRFFLYFTLLLLFLLLHLLLLLLFPSHFLPPTLCPPTRWLRRERFIATRLLAVATFCGFWRRKNSDSGYRRPDTGLVAAARGAKCSFFHPVANRQIMVNRIPRRNNALRLSLNQLETLVFFLWELAMTYDVSTEYFHHVKHIAGWPRKWHLRRWKIVFSEVLTYSFIEQNLSNFFL